MPVSPQFSQGVGKRGSEIGDARTSNHPISQFYSPDSLLRKVYGVLGVPLDLLDFSGLLRAIDNAVDNRAPFLISTPNVNFVMACRLDKLFRDSLLLSDLCLVDGMPVVWIARLLGIPVRERLAGSDLFDALKSRPDSQRRLKLFLFGGGEGVAADLANTLNDKARAMECVGAHYPGYGSVEDMSQTHIIDAINSSGADLLAVFLGAEKAQKWLLRNHHRLKIPVRINFGATINFQTGTVKRAPKFMRSSGLEWLWRIKEEPYLWRRYWADGKGIIYLLLTSALPFAISNWKNQTKDGRDELMIERSEDHETVIISLSGSAIIRHVDKAVACFRDALLSGKQISVDLSRVRSIDPRFFGLFLMVNKQDENRRLVFKGISSRMKRTFRWNGFSFLLDGEAPLDRIL